MASIRIKTGERISLQELPMLGKAIEQTVLVAVVIDHLASHPFVLEAAGPRRGARARSDSYDDDEEPESTSFMLNLGEVADGFQLSFQPLGSREHERELVGPIDYAAHAFRVRLSESGSFPVQFESPNVVALALPEALDAIRVSAIVKQLLSPFGASAEANRIVQRRTELELDARARLRRAEVLEQKRGALHARLVEAVNKRPPESEIDKLKRELEELQTEASGLRSQADSLRASASRLVPAIVIPLGDKGGRGKFVISRNDPLALTIERLVARGALVGVEQVKQRSASHDSLSKTEAQAALNSLLPLMESKASTLYVGADEVKERARIPRTALSLFMTALAHYAQGNRALAIPMDAVLTTQEAADFLNVSRPFLVKLLDEGKIPHERVGTHRRVRMSNLIEYRQRDDNMRNDILAEMANDAQKLGIY